ncbi:coiled-coil domain-containing protein 180-like [Liolophura sinensis]|uniref:coiled-coil domain-containing protein 180-like n=1 Tax=Liolophura sinensis TaxID=3198878 RepID=UPI0031580E99
MSAEVKPSARVVPSGKVYRQMFDAQVQLTQSLSKGRREPTIISREDGIPLVRSEQRDGLNGFLNSRQKTWVDCFPNDPHTENPVLYKQYTEFVSSKLKVPDSETAGAEVRGLPDVVLPARTGSDIIDRIAKSRRNRHEAAVEDMRHELSEISQNLEPRIAEAGEMLMNSLEENETEINRLLAKVEKDEDLITYRMQGLSQLWRDIESHSSVRQQWIEEFDVTCHDAEKQRSMLVREVFMKYTKLLEKISHLLEPDLHKMLDRESQMINQTVLSNKRSYADLFMRLMCADMERERTQHAWWLRRVADWKTLHTNDTIDKFRAFMQSKAVEEPSCLQMTKTLTESQVQALNVRRVDLINSLRDFKPPTSTKSAVYSWNSQMSIVSEEIDHLNQQYVIRLKEEYEKVAQTWLDEIERMKISLIESEACTEEAARLVVERDFLPLIGEKQRAFEQKTEEMEKAFDKHHEEMQYKLKSLFKYSQGAAHMWDIHEIGLAKQERALQEKLDAGRQAHDLQNQEKEAALDAVMDRMRQDGSEGALAESLKKALDMLTKIRNSYDIFHQQQVDIVQTYPAMVTQELQNFDASVCKFFAVDRTHPDDAARETTEKEEREEATGSVMLTSPRKKKKKSAKTRPESQGSDSVKGSPSLPMIVSEILSTSKGTTFYVLTEAGEHGVQETTKEDDTNYGAFLTEAPSLEEIKADYLQWSNITDSLLFENPHELPGYLEEWKEQAVERANSVVAAKCEELNNELDLRLHLHQPRARRAELDIHNVRAAELVMHSERVSRHCKGIQQGLTDLRQQFVKVTQEHNKLARKFRDDVESLESVFINATKSAKLIALQGQLSLELDKYMSIIRASLREFRKHLDETLSTLRESNARFIKSFKLFSAGGNFCPEEIQEYHKRLEKMSHKLDAAEGAIMLDLEGMESKRLEHATKVSVEFEDRFKNHMFDLIFMEKIARWLTNTQVKIKAEVASSNSQAQALGRHISDVRRRVDACERPNLDKEQITATELNDSLKTVFDDFHNRSVYLNCISDLPAAGPMQGPPALGGRVAFTGEVTQISKPGRQPSEDPSVVVIKSIMKAQRNKMKFGPDADLDGDYPAAFSPTGGEGKERFVAPGLPRTGTQISVIDKSVTRLGSRRGTAVASGPPAVDLPRRTQSSLRRGSKTTRWDRKYLVFGDTVEEVDSKHFLGGIRKVLREAQEGLFTVAEIFYKQKGSRAVTRPQALQDNFDHCADALVFKLQSYFNQAETYHNQCLQEFRSQLMEIEEVVSHIPPLIIQQVVQSHISEARNQHTQLQDQLSLSLKGLQNTQINHQNMLRPSLGHPQQREELEALTKAESQRHDDYIHAVNQHAAERQSALIDQSERFLEELSRTSEAQILQYDQLLIVDDVLIGIVEPKKFPTSELIRRKTVGLPLEEEAYKCVIPRGKNTWPGLPANEFVLKTTGEPSQKPKQTASVTTAKTTLGHSSAVKARDSAYQEYKKYFKSVLADIEEKKQTQLTAEERWMQNWATSVQKVKDLYS